MFPPPVNLPFLFLLWVSRLLPRPQLATSSQPATSSPTLQPHTPDPNARVSVTDTPDDPMNPADVALAYRVAHSLQATYRRNYLNRCLQRDSAAGRSQEGA